MNPLRSLLFLVGVLVLSPLLSCSETTDPSQEEPSNPGADSRSVGISFSVPEVSETATAHNYVYDGYTVLAYGAEDEVEIKDVDLRTGPFEAQIFGDISITIFHPDFEADSISTRAYFGLVNQVISSADAEVRLDLELVQGFVIAKSTTGNSNGINEILINNQQADLDRFYYTAAEEIQIYISTSQGVLAGSETLSPGEGVQYMIDPIQSNIQIYFPGYQDASDGNLDFVQPIIQPDFVNNYDSFTVNPDGSIDIQTGSKSSNVFIPFSNLQAGLSVAQYDISGLQLYWLENFGETARDISGYLNVYLFDSKGNDLELTIMDNGFIELVDMKNGKVLGQYGDINTRAAGGNGNGNGNNGNNGIGNGNNGNNGNGNGNGNNSNEGSLDDFFDDFGHYEVQYAYVDANGPIGNFIWRADLGSGEFRVESYYVSINPAKGSVIDIDNILGGYITENDVRNGSVTVDTGTEEVAILVKSNDLIDGGRLKDYDVSKIYNGLKVRWKEVIVPASNSALYVYLSQDGSLNDIKEVMVDSDGNVFVDGLNYASVDDMMTDFEEFYVLRDYVLTKDGITRSGNFIWRTGDQRGRITVFSYSVR
jgi:hypothetical protein